MDDYYFLDDAESFVFSAENQTGTKEGGGRGGDCTKLSPKIYMEPGQTVTIAEIDGPGEIDHMWFTGVINYGCIIRIYWEHSEIPSVESPLPAFFGCAYCENMRDVEGRYPFLNSAMIMVAPARGYNCYWKMPFHSHCKITITNIGVEKQIIYYVVAGKRKKQPENIGYFHAAYRQEHPVQKGRAYTVIDQINGRGKFVGVTLSVGLNGTNHCWVEGEARMYVDDDRYPSVHYTGTEDYFGGSYAFGNDQEIHKYQTYSALYSGMYSVLGQNTERYNTQQRFMLYRFHIADPIYFKKNFRMTFDNMSLASPRYDDYTSVAYWYQTLPASPQPSLPAFSELSMK